MRHSMWLELTHVCFLFYHAKHYTTEYIPEVLTFIKKNKFDVIQSECFHLQQFVISFSFTEINDMIKS